MPTREMTGGWENDAKTLMAPSDWLTEKAYRIHVLITKDEEEIYSAVALNLPGLGSCGTTEEEAMENFREAACGILESYRQADALIPWRDTTSDDIPFGAKQKWIIVNG